jgi:hypothetical protein
MLRTGVLVVQLDLRGLGAEGISEKIRETLYKIENECKIITSLTEDYLKPVSRE